jgi:hypothetical protein
MKQPDRLFIGLYPAGVVYADRETEVNGDYKRCAFLPYDTLDPHFQIDCPPELREAIMEDVFAMQAKSGQLFQVSTCGQTVLLGKLKKKGGDE